MPNQKTRQDQLIDALYDLVLNPNNFNSFAELLEEYLHQNEELVSLAPETYEHLSHHFDRAFQILERSGLDHALENLTLDNFIGVSNRPSIAITLSGRVLEFNNDAKKLFSITQRGQLIQDLVHPKAKAIVFDVLAQAGTTQTMELVILLPNNQPALMRLKKLNDTGIIIIDFTGHAWDQGLQTILKSMYSLTNTECAVAELLYQGHSVRDIAERESRALGTVRQHTKSLLKKTQTHSQPRLMRLLTSLNFAQSHRDQEKWSNSKCPNYSLTLPDGRKYAYYDTGAKHKKVIVVLHGALHDPQLPDVMHDSLGHQAYRIIGPSRAGFGGSSASLNNDDLLKNSATDLIALLDHLKLDSVILLGQMSGASHAYATAALHPARIELVVNIAGMTPLDSENQIASMPKGARAIVRTARYFPKFLPALTRTAQAIIESDGIRKLLDMNYQNSSVDLATTNHEEVFQRLCIGYRFAAQNGYIAYTNEALALAEDLSHYVERVQCGISLIHGNQDRISSITSIHNLAQAHDNIHLIVIDDAGQLLIHTKPEVTTKALIERLTSTTSRH